MSDQNVLQELRNLAGMEGPERPINQFFTKAHAIVEGVKKFHAANAGWVEPELNAKIKEHIDVLQAIIPLFLKLQFTPASVWEKFRAHFFHLGETCGWSWLEEAWNGWESPVPGATHYTRENLNALPLEDRIKFFDLNYFRGPYAGVWRSANIPLREDLADVQPNEQLEIKFRDPLPNCNTTCFRLLPDTDPLAKTADDITFRIGKTWTPIPGWDARAENKDMLLSFRWVLEIRKVKKAQSHEPVPISREDDWILEKERQAAEERKQQDGRLNDLLSRL